MGFWRKIRSSLSFILLLGLIGACAAPPQTAPGAHFYLTSELTYLRDAGSYEGNVAGQLYKGDQVERLETADSGWWRVRSGRTGQTGWVPGKLFSPQPVPVADFFVIQSVHLRECPKEVCPSLQLLSRGERVQKLEANRQGWWRVLVTKSRNLGWLPAGVLTENLEKTREPGKTYLYVAAPRLKLYRQPQMGAKVVKLLLFNEQVEKLTQDQTVAGWLKVRQPASSAVGWVQDRYLAALPSGYPRGPRRPRIKAKPVQPAKNPEPSSAQPVESSPPPEPEIM